MTKLPILQLDFAGHLREVHPSITLARLMQANERRRMTLDDPGLCVSCGNEQTNCEPDARRYRCEACGERAVYGAQELLMRVLP
jgi:predicted RNA-binding Zn-ribbon protein involved in translation (DUF1610 family)